MTDAEHIADLQHRLSLRNLEINTLLKLLDEVGVWRSTANERRREALFRHVAGCAECQVTYRTVCTKCGFRPATGGAEFGEPGMLYASCDECRVTAGNRP